MRDIKFRAWDEMQKVMHNNFQFIKSGDDGNDWILFTSDKQPIFNYDGWSKNPYFSQQLKIMQYTGLKDRNGKEIYEGDIVYVEEMYSGDYLISSYIGVVIWEDGGFFIDGLEKSLGGELDTPTIINGAIKIIGNIHENPELA